MQNEANLVILISKYIPVIRRTFYNDNKVIQYEDTLILNFYALNNTASKYIKQNLTTLKEKQTSSDSQLGMLAQFYQ